MKKFAWIIIIIIIVIHFKDRCILQKFAFQTVKILELERMFYALMMMRVDACCHFSHLHLFQPMKNKQRLFHDWKRTVRVLETIFNHDVIELILKYE